VRVLITGAAGFAGRALATHCRSAGDDVRAAPRAAVCDLRDAVAVRELVAATAPEVVYHLAARAHVGASWQDPAGTVGDNVAMTINVLEAVRAVAPRAVVLHAGSSEGYGPPATLPIAEDAPLRPQNPYAVSKTASDLAAGFYADAHGLRVVRVRAFNHAGPGQDPGYVVAAFASQIAAAARAGRDPVELVTGNLETRRDFTDVRDVVAAYRLLAARGEAGVFNVCSGVAHSGREIVDGLARAAGVTVVDRVDPARLRANEVLELRGSAARLREATGWQPRIPFERTLADTLAFWRDQLA